MDDSHPKTGVNLLKDTGVVYIDGDLICDMKEIALGIYQVATGNKYPDWFLQERLRGHERMRDTFHFTKDILEHIISGGKRLGPKGISREHALKICDEEMDKTPAQIGVCEYVMSMKGLVPNLKIYVITSYKELFWRFGQSIVRRLPMKELSFLDREDTYISENELYESDIYASDMDIIIAKKLCHAWIIDHDHTGRLVGNICHEGGSLTALEEGSCVEMKGRIYPIEGIHGYMSDDTAVWDIKKVHPLERITPDWYKYTKSLWGPSCSVAGVGKFGENSKKMELPLWGQVVQGPSRSGHLLGVPSASIRLKGEDSLNGVYYGKARFTHSDGKPVNAGELFPCVISVSGVFFRKRYDPRDKAIEVHLFKTFECEFYGSYLHVDVEGRLRPHLRYGNFKQLLRAIQLDCEVAQELLNGVSMR